MKPNLHFFACLFLFALLCSAFAAGDDNPPAALLTVAEKSDFKATARYEEVAALLDRLAAAAPLARKAELGKTGEGRSIPALILADPPVATPEEAAKQVAESGKLIVLAIGNIHAGEVDGKEGLPILARELILWKEGKGNPEGAEKTSVRTPPAGEEPSFRTPTAREGPEPQKNPAIEKENPPGGNTHACHPLLKDLIIIFAPIYNADGNERVSKDNRPGQVGPEEGMGRRENAAGLDLNRDFVKLEASETRGLVDFINRWNPDIFIDTHTTNGCYHRYIITYEGPKALAGSGEIIRFARDTMMPQIARDLLQKYNVPAFVYGDFTRDHARWETYPAQARYGTSYVGLRNRLSILSEGYSYATYKQRVLGTRDFVKACLEYAAANKAQIRKLLKEVDAATIAVGKEPKPDDLVAIRSEPLAAPQKVMAAGFVEKKEGGRVVSTGEPKDYEVELWTHYKPTLTVRRPFAYLFPAELKNVVEKLQQHGVEVETLSEETELPVEVYRLDKIDFLKMSFQNHRMAEVAATARPETRRFPAGTVLVRTGQELGSLVVYLLEPQCEDGLTTWNYFDEHLKAGQDFPAVRLPAPAALKSRRLDSTPGK